MTDEHRQTIRDFKDVIASIEGAKEEIMSIVSRVTYKNKPTTEDMTEIKRINTILKRIRL